MASRCLRLPLTPDMEHEVTVTLPGAAEGRPYSLAARLRFAFVQDCQRFFEAVVTARVKRPAKASPCPLHKRRAHFGMQSQAVRGVSRKRFSFPACLPADPLGSLFENIDHQGIERNTPVDRLVLQDLMQVVWKVSGL